MQSAPNAGPKRNTKWRYKYGDLRDVTLFPFAQRTLKRNARKTSATKAGIFGNPFKPVSVPEHAVLLSSLVFYSS